MGDGTRAKACLVGEDAAGDALLHTDEQAADGAAREGRRVERTCKDGLDHRRKALNVQNNDAHSQHDVEQCHEGHQPFTDAADALDAAQQHHGDKHRHNDADNEVQSGKRVLTDHIELRQGRVDGGDDGVDLGRVAGAKNRQHAEQRVEHGQELPVLAQTVFDVVHRAADPLAGGAALPKMYSERDLRKFGAHTQQRGAPHPEHCARPADGDSARNARNVARAHRACQRRADGLERRHRTIRGILFAEHTPDGGFDRIREFADLQKARPHTEQQPHADDAHHRRDAPHKVVDRLIDGCYCFKNHKIPYLLPFDFAAKNKRPAIPAFLPVLQAFCPFMTSMTYITAIVV